MKLGQFVTCSELAVLSISLKNLVKVSLLQIGEPGTSLPPQAIFQDVSAEVLDAVGDVRDNMNKLSLPMPELDLGTEN